MRACVGQGERFTWHHVCASAVRGIGSCLTRWTSVLWTAMRAMFGLEEYEHGSWGKSLLNDICPASQIVCIRCVVVSPLMIPLAGLKVLRVANVCLLYCVVYSAGHVI